MSRWSQFGWYQATPKKPPPESGVRVKATGTTWWGKRWTTALEEVLDGDSGRLSRGRTYARAGRVHDLEIKAGKVNAKVTGSRRYDITIALAHLSETAWDKAIAAMAAEARFSAELLAGQMPQTIDEAFLEGGVSLFPRTRDDLRTSCSCPDWGDPCKHVAATHYVLGDALDRDPFLLFELRGKTKTQVLDALRLARGQGEPTKEGKGKPKKLVAEPEVATVKLKKVKAADYDRPREALPAMHFTFDEPAAHGAVLRQLGEPTAWEGDASPTELLAPLVRAAAATARWIATMDPSQAEAAEATPPDEKPTKRRAPSRGARKT